MFAVSVTWIAKKCYKYFFRNFKIAGLITTGIRLLISLDILPFRHSSNYVCKMFESRRRLANQNIDRSPPIRKLHFEIPVFTDIILIYTDIFYGPGSTSPSRF